jgi:polyphosphate kinase 2 (PPK2 family)
MKYCTESEHRRFLQLCPQMERSIIETGIILIKIWLEVGMKEQERRFKARITDPLRQWKMSPMDLESFARWYSYSKARDLMLEATDSEHSPWHILRSDDKRRARLNGIAHILSLIPYKKIKHRKVKLPKRSFREKYDDSSPLLGRKAIPERF